MAIASVIAAAFAGLVATRAGFTTVVLLVFDNIVAFVNLTFAIRTGTFGDG